MTDLDGVRGDLHELQGEVRALGGLGQDVRDLQAEVRSVGEGLALVANRLTVLEMRRELTTEKERAAEDRMRRHSDRIRTLEIDTQSFRDFGPRVDKLSEQLADFDRFRAKLIGYAAAASAIGGVLSAIAVAAAIRLLFP